MTPKTFGGLWSMVLAIGPLILQVYVPLYNSAQAQVW